MQESVARCVAQGRQFLVCANMLEDLHVSVLGTGRYLGLCEKSIGKHREVVSRRCSILLCATGSTLADIPRTLFTAWPFHLSFCTIVLLTWPRFHEDFVSTESVLLDEEGSPPS